MRSGEMPRSLFTLIGKSEWSDKRTNIQGLRRKQPFFIMQPLHNHAGPARTSLHRVVDNPKRTRSYRTRRKSL